MNASRLLIRYALMNFHGMGGGPARDGSPPFSVVDGPLVRIAKWACIWVHGRQVRMGYVAPDRIIIIRYRVPARGPLPREPYREGVISRYTITNHSAGM